MKLLSFLSSVKQAFASVAAFFALLLIPVIGTAQTDFGNVFAIDEDLLNEHIVHEVNKLRKKAHADSLSVCSELSEAARFHVGYMRSKEKLTHFERFNKQMKTPKNRVDFYGGLFHIVGENVQLNNMNFGAPATDKKHPPINTYELLAEALVTTWKNSPPHYANMINGDFESTYTAISVTEDGKIYACQLFGGPVYDDKYKDLNDTVNYKPESDARCNWCKKRPPIGTVMVTENREIFFVFQTGLRWPRWGASRMRLFNPWNDGLAADIVLKSQYPCDSSSYFNGRRGVRGIPLQPVYKKDFGLIGVFNTSIYLGKVPDYVDEEFEVNVTVVKNKRTCSNIQFHVIPSEFHVNIPLDFGFAPGNSTVKSFKRDTLTERLYFDKSAIEPGDTSTLAGLSRFIGLNKNRIERIELAGFASIEGKTDNNVRLYSERASYLKKYLAGLGIDTNTIRTTTNENFAGFRESIAGTSYEKLGELTDKELKERLTDGTLIRELEPFLKEQRYVEVHIISKDTTRFYFSKEIVQQMLNTAIARRDRRAYVDLQRIQYRLLLDGEMALSDLDFITYPFNKKFFLPIHNEAIMRFQLDTLNAGRYDRLESDLQQLYPIDSTNIRLRTSLAILEYYRYSAGGMKLSHRKYYKRLRRKKYVDPVQKSRMLLNFASDTDWWKRRPIYARRVRSVISKAKLDVDKTFELATYYAYFNMPKIAYDLTKRKIDDTENPEDLIFFLKLIYLMDIRMSRNEYLRYFERIRKYSGKEFCTFFNSPALNFQIFDDEEVKAIYCEECEGN